MNKPILIPRAASRIMALAFSVLLMAAAISLAHGAQPSCPSLLDHRFPRLQDGVSQDLCQHQGKVVLVVNTASYCGYTNQYDGLEKLYARLSGRGLVVLGFPSNDFEQEPGNDKQIADFCRLTYGVKFPMLGKTGVAAGRANPFYEALARASGERPKWNFHKYLIDRDGRTVMSFPSSTIPDDPQFVAAIEQRLGR